MRSEILAACDPAPPLKIVPLGDASSSNGVNNCIFRHHAVVTRDEWQFTAWYLDSERMILARRRLSDDHLETFTLPGAYRITDAHNCISLGIDSAGYLHISYNHHTHPLHYRRSLKPLDIQGWTDELSMTGHLEDGVTYPYFVMMPATPADRQSLGNLLFFYRDGHSGNGDLCLKAYDAESRQWVDRAVPVLKGTNQEPWTTNAYWNTPAIEPGGAIHLSYTWRVNNIYRDGKAWFNKDINYLRTEDQGLTWKTHAGRPMPLPVTPATSEIIWPAAPFTNLINQCSSAVNEEGQLHVAYYGADAEGFTNYHHLWSDGARWRNDTLSSRRHTVNLSGGGALQLPLSRPQIIMDRKQRVYVIYRGDLTGEKLVAQRLDPPHYEAPGTFFLLWDKPLGFAEPVLDLVRWQRDGILTLFILENDQEQFDAPQPNKLRPAFLADFRLD